MKLRILISSMLLVITFFVPLYAQKKVKIAFALNELSFRGIEVSTFDYAHYNELLLGNESIIINFDVDTQNEVRTKFIQRFGQDKFFDCVNADQLDDVLLREHVDIFYFQKPGSKDGKISTVCKNVIHAVFPGFIEVHGDVYAYISDWFTRMYPQLNISYVPYMVRVEQTDQNLRKELNIPQDALVFGRHGGYESFNVICAQNAVKAIAIQRPDIFFVFLNTHEFCQLPNVIFLPKTTDMLYKAKFINTCDAMIHGRWRGETFGLACAEFSIKNKPIITWLGSQERAHIDLLGDKAFYYNNKEELLDILLSFKKEPGKNWDAYSQQFSPEKVMQKFDEVFIRPLIKDEVKKENLSVSRTMPFILSNINGVFNHEFLHMLQTSFNVQVLVKIGSYWSENLDHVSNLFDKIEIIESDEQLYKQLVSHAVSGIHVHHGKTVGALMDILPALQNSNTLFWFDARWYHDAQGKQSPLMPFIAELDEIAGISSEHFTIFIDGVHFFDHALLGWPTFEQLYAKIKNMGYNLLIVGDALIAHKNKNIIAAPVIRAMTISRLCDLPEFANQTMLRDLLNAEKTIAHASQADIKLLEELAVLSTDNSIRHYRLWHALVLSNNREYPAAAHLFDAIISAGYNNWRVYWYLAQTLFNMSDPRALHAMQQVATSYPNFWGIEQFRYITSR